MDWKSLFSQEIIDFSAKGEQFISVKREEWRQKDQNYPDLVREAKGIKG